MTMVTDKEIKRAVELGTKFAPVVQRIQYHRKSDCLEFGMGWCTLTVDRKHIEELRDLLPSEMEAIYLREEGIHLDTADIDISAAGLIAALAHELAEQADKAA
jgi:hypothetical protein